MNLSVESLAMDVVMEGEDTSMHSLKRSNNQKEEEPKKKAKWETINVVVQRSSNSSEVTMETHPHLFWKECETNGYRCMIYMNNRSEEKFRNIMDPFTKEATLLYLDLLPTPLKTIVNKDLDYAMNRENVERKQLVLKEMIRVTQDMKQRLDDFFTTPSTLEERWLYCPIENRIKVVQCKREVYPYWDLYIHKFFFEQRNRNDYIGAFLALTRPAHFKNLDASCMLKRYAHTIARDKTGYYYFQSYPWMFGDLMLDENDLPISFLKKDEIITEFHFGKWDVKFEI